MKTEEIVKQFEGEMNKYHAEMKKYNSAMEKYHREEEKYLKAIDGRLHIELGIYKPQCFHGYVSFFIPEKIYKKVLAAYREHAIQEKDLHEPVKPFKPTLVIATEDDDPCPF